MATWGAYFSSYVRKSPAGENAAADGNEVLSVVQPLKPAVKASAITGTGEGDTTATDGFKRSNTPAKKLYEIPTEFPKNTLQNSTSNAARVARLFGYSNANADATPAKVNGNEKLGNIVAQAVAQVSDEETRQDQKRSDIIAGLFAKKSDVALAAKDEEIMIGLQQDIFSDATIMETERLSMMNMKEVATEETFELTKVGLYNTLSSQTLKPDEAQGATSAELETVITRSPMNLISKAGPKILARLPDTALIPPSSKTIEASARAHKPSLSRRNNDIQAMLDDFASQATDVFTPTNFPEKAGASPTKPDIPKTKGGESKSDAQNMLDIFASQAQTPVSVDHVFKNESLGTKLKVDVRVKPNPRRKESRALDMLGFFASQADPSAGPANESQKLWIAAKTSGSLDQYNMEKKLQPPSRRNKSLEMLDFFANQATSSISEDKPLGTIRNMNLSPLPEKKALAEVPKVPLATIAQNPEEEEALKVSPSKLQLANLTGIQEQARTITLERGPATPITVKSPGKDSKTPTRKAENRLVVPPLTAAPPTIIRAAKSLQTNAPSPIKRANPSRGSVTSFELRPIMDKDDQEIEESAVDFRERFLEYEKQAEQIRLEKEQMEIEHERMLQEIAMFQKEADRIAEEEAAMKKFMENLEAERLRDAENEDRKCREREARMEAERLERERIETERLEKEMLLKEEKIRLKAEKEEADKVIAKVLEKERMARAEEARIDAEIEDIRRRKMEARLEQERQAQEEVNRLNAEMRRYAEEAEADRLLMEEALEREEAERLEAERTEKEESLARESLRYQREQEEYERQRDEDEGFARQQRRAAREASERLEYEQKMAEEEAQYAEEEFQSAERDRLAEIQRRRDEARYAKQDHPAAGIRNQNVVSDDDSESEDEILKAERKIKDAFAKLAKERGQAPAPGPAPIKRANTAQDIMQRQPDRGPRLRAQDDRTDVRVSRNNTVGARLQPPRKDQSVMRGNTTRGRPLIQGGLPNGPRQRRE